MADPIKTAPAKPTDPSALFEIWRSLQLVWALMLDGRVPVFYKLIVPLALLYVVIPFDFDFIPFLGWMDDVAVLFFGIRWFIQLCPPDVVMEHRRALGGGREYTSDEYVDGSYRVVDEDK